MKEPTKIKILSAARKLFVAHGYAGTSIGSIVKEAGINHSLVFHHFGNKQKLWLAVKMNIVQQAKSNSPTLPSTRLSLEKFIHNFLVHSFRFYKNTPDLIRLFNWQRMEGSKTNIGVTKSKEMQVWTDAVKHYQDKGDIKKELRLEFIITMVTALTSSAALDPNIFIKKQQDLNAYLNFCVDSILLAIT